MHRRDFISPTPNLCELLMKSNPSWSENNMMNNPSNALMLTTWPWDCHCGFVGEQRSRKQCAINAFYEASFAQGRKPIHLCLAGVYFMCCTFTHISTALFYTFENTVCHLAHRCTFTHPQTFTHTRHRHTLKQFPSHFCSSSWLRCIIGHSYAIV